MFTKNTIVVFTIAFLLAVVFSAPFTFDDSQSSLTDAVSLAEGPGDPGGGGVGGGDGSGGSGEGPGDPGGGGVGETGGGCCGTDNPDPDTDNPGDPGRDNPVVPSCTITLDKNKIASGEQVIATWSSQNAVSASINQFGDVARNNQNGRAKTLNNNQAADKTVTFRMTVTSSDGTTRNCSDTVEVISLPQCTVNLAPQTVTVGQTAILSWTTTNADSAVVRRNGEDIATAKNNQGKNQTLAVGTYNYVVIAQKAGVTNARCPITLTVDPESTTPTPRCTLTVNGKAEDTITKGDTVNFKLTGTNISGTGELFNALNDKRGDLTIGQDLPVVINGLGAGKIFTAKINGIECTATLNIEDQPTPTEPNISIVKDDNDDKNDTQAVDAGTTATFSIVVTNDGNEDLKDVVVTDALTPSCNKTIGNLAIGASDTYTCDATNVQAGFTNTANVTGKSVVDDQVVNDDDTSVVTITTPDTFSCANNVSFTGNGQSSTVNLSSSGGDVNFVWTVTGADSIEIDNDILANTSTLSDSATKNFTADADVVLTAKKAGFTDIQCPIKIDVDTGGGSSNLTCSISANRTDVGEGNLYTVTWNVGGTPDNVRISEIGSGLADSGSQELRAPNGDATVVHTLTATKGSDSVTCDVTISVDGGGGGGGGGSSRPRCDFDASDTRIRAGQEITLTWDTSRGRELAIFEGSVRTGERIFETEDDDRVEEGSIRVRPTEDTTYTLLVERGSRDRQCDVKIEVVDDVVISSVRTQGQVAGISLTSVPYTGFEAGPVLTFIFYAVLAAWALFVAYLLVIKEDKVLGVSLAGAYPKRKFEATDYSTEASTSEVETSEAAAYVASMTSDVATPVVSVPEAVAAPGVDSTPSNLPTAVVTGFVEAEVSDEVTEADEDMKALEDRAHANKILLSSDAMRHFLSICPKEINRLAFLDQVIAEAKVSYPNEDGWVVLNLERMHELCEKRRDFMPTAQKVEVAEEKKIDAGAFEVPTGAGSLAEAIVSGNIAAAYQLLGNRPMLALADAAADLDSLYRSRKGEEVAISDMLAQSAITTEQLEAAIAALTSAIDGTYTDEAAAVKMAIMKAVKATS